MLVIVALISGLTTGAGAATSQYASYAYLAISRSGAAVYVNALVHQESAAGMLASSYRTVYLQRLLSGHWQNVLARNADRRGHVTVGFLSAPSYSYRLVVPASGNTLGATSASATSPALGGVLRPGQSLVAGTALNSSISSPSEWFRLSVESPSQYVLDEDAYVASAGWTMGTTVQQVDGKPSVFGKSRMTMQTNGDLVITTAAGQPVWSSHTSGAGNALYMQDDGNAVIYNRLSRAVWATHTTALELIPGTTIPSGMSYVFNRYITVAPGHVGRLTMQRDGNLALYAQSTLIWSSNTHIPGSHAAYTVNGTLAVYSPGGTVLWRSHSYGAISVLIVNCGSLEFHQLGPQSTYFPIPSKYDNCH